MKKLIIDTCNKTAFCFNNKIYKQINAASVESPLGHVLIYIKMTNLKRTIVKELYDQSIVELYMRYLDETLLLVEEIDIYLVQKPLNFFYKNIKLTADNFKDGKVYFLDI